MSFKNLQKLQNFYSDNKSLKESKARAYAVKKDEEGTLVPSQDGKFTYHVDGIPCNEYFDTKMEAELHMREKCEGVLCGSKKIFKMVYVGGKEPTRVSEGEFKDLADDEEPVSSPALDGKFTYFISKKPSNKYFSSKKDINVSGAEIKKCVYVGPTVPKSAPKKSRADDLVKESYDDVNDKFIKDALDLFVALGVPASIIDAKKQLVLKSVRAKKSTIKNRTVLQTKMNALMQLVQGNQEDTADHRVNESLEMYCVTHVSGFGGLNGTESEYSSVDFAKDYALDYSFDDDDRKAIKALKVGEVHMVDGPRSSVKVQRLS